MLAIAFRKFQFESPAAVSHNRADLAMQQRPPVHKMPEGGVLEECCHVVNPNLVAHILNNIISQQSREVLRTRMAVMGLLLFILISRGTADPI